MQSVAAEGPVKSAPESAGGQQRTVLLVTHVVPFPPAAGNEIRILRLLAWLRRQGFRVVLLLAVRQLPQEVATELERRVDSLVTLGPGDSLVTEGDGRNSFARRLAAALEWRLPDLERRIGTFPGAAAFIGALRALSERALYGSPAERRRRLLCPPDLIATTRRLCENEPPTAVIVEYIFLSDCLAVVPAGTLKFIDTIDMFSLKRSGVLAHGISDMFACSPAEEREQLLKADIVIAIQAREAALMARLVPERHVIQVGVDFDLTPPSIGVAPVRGRVLVVASDNALNVHGVAAFLENAWPLVRARCPWAVLRIVGKVVGRLAAVPAGVECAGWVAGLADEYAAAEVVVNPVIAGTGLKIKTVEALCHGKAVVAWPNGVDGLPVEGEPPFLTADSWQTLAEAVAGLLAECAPRASLESRATEYAKATFATERVYAPLHDALRR